MKFTNRKEKENYQLSLARKSKILYWAETKLRWRPKMDEETGKIANYQILLLGCAEDGLYRYPDDYPITDPKVNLRGKPIRKFAWRIGRQCLPGDEVIHDRDGSLTQIKNHPNAWKTFDSKEVFEVKVEGGYAIRCTGNHPVMTKNGWVEAQHLKRGDLVQVMDSWNKFGNGIVKYNYNQRITRTRTDNFSGEFEFNNDLAELVGWITADGSVKNGQSIKFTNINVNYLKRVEYLVQTHFKDITVTWYAKGKGFDLLFTTKGDKSRFNPLKDFFRKMDFESGFPRAITYATREQTAHFLRAMFAADGYIGQKKNGKPEFGLSCGNHRLYAQYCRELLNKFGVHSQIKAEWMKKSTALFYRVMALGKQNALRFQENIGPVLDKNFESLEYKKNYTSLQQQILQDGEIVNYRRLLSVVSIGEQEVWDVEFPGKGWFFSGGLQISNSGKCLPKNTIIHTRDGKLIPIEEHPDAFPTRENAIIYNLETASGYSIRSTDNHPISTRRNGIQQWVRMDELTIGDDIECLYEWQKWGNGIIPYSFDILKAAGSGKLGYWRKTETMSGLYEMNDELAELLGWITSDGNFRPHKTNTINFRNTNLNYINRVKELVNKNFPEIKTVINEYKSKGTEKDNYFLSFYSPDGVGKSRNTNTFRYFLMAMNNHECGFPRAVAEHFTKSQVCSFFRGLYAGDGNFYFNLKPQNMHVESTLACSLNRTYAEYCHSLLLKLGIVTKICSQIGQKATAPFYTVRFRNQLAMVKFRDTIGQILDKPIPLGDKFGRKKIAKRYSRIPHQSGIDGENFIWDKIKKITIEEERQDCYDVTYPEKGWFIANGVKVHNSECLAVIALYLSIRKPIRMTRWERYKDKELISEDNPTGWTKKETVYYRGAKTIVASADATKVKLVFDRVMKLINESPEYSLMLEAGVIEQKLHPFPQLTFHATDWSEPGILSFRGPGANGQALRGSTFDYKLYDEVDYIPKSFFEAELATTINAGESALTILSSTPSGRREQFYYACFEAGTEVLMADGSFKFIENIKEGDQVINRLGIAEPVTAVMSRIYSGWLTSFTTTLGTKITRATVNHKFMAVRGDERHCKACSSIVWNNRSYCPVYGFHTGYEKLEPEYIEIGKLNLGDFLAIPKNQIKDKNLISFFHEDDKFIYVVIDSIHKVRTFRTRVYNLTVGEDHSYCVDYYGVANCTNAEWGYEEFHFPSWENPSYNETTDKELREKLTSIAYEHEIMADWGTVEEGVFNWNYFKDVFDYVYTKRTLEQKRRNIGFDEYTFLKLDFHDVKNMGVNNLGFWLQKRLPPKKDFCKYYFGADLGYSSDPSEFVVFEQYQGIMKMILRLHSDNITYDIQCDLIAAFDKHFMFDMLGMDQGNAGVAVEQMLKSDLFSGNGFNKYASHKFKDRLVAVQFGQKVSVGNIAGKDQIVPVKQWMTDLIIKQAEERLLIMPNTDFDPDIENQFRNHTYTIGGNGNILYSKSEVYPDHVVDAVRTAFNAKCTAMLPAKRKWPVGSSFKSRARGAWG